MLRNKNQHFTISLIVTTYNWREALAAVLESVFRQLELPLEVIVADDGSRDDTRALVEELAQKSPVPLRHCWHPDTGFRLAEIRNKAIAMAAGDYIVMVDGDMVLHPQFIQLHRRIANRNQFIQGKRVLLDGETSQRLLQQKLKNITPFTTGIKNRFNAINSGLLSSLLSVQRHDIKAIRGCNMGFWKKDVLHVNGFNEDFVGWGREDSEFAVRLLNSGVKRKNMAFGGAGYHLYHPENPRQSLPANDAILEKAIRENHTHCANGISKHLPK